MAAPLKVRSTDTDARSMSDTAVTTTDQTASPPDHRGMLLDGEAPRLGTVPIVPPTPFGDMTGPASDLASPIAEPTMSPILSTVALEDMPTLPTAPVATPMTVDVDNDAPADTGDPQHPMAHLMPARSMPNEASIRAAEKRAIKKAKAKKIKIAVIAGALAFTALVGPPLVSWLTNAINETGTTQDDSAD
jgi:hypothetical protein